MACLFAGAGGCAEPAAKSPEKVDDDQHTTQKSTSTASTASSPSKSCTTTSSSALPYYQPVYSYSQPSSGVGVAQMQEGRKVHATTYTPAVGTISGPVISTAAVKTTASPVNHSPGSKSFPSNNDLYAQPSTSSSHGEDLRESDSTAIASRQQTNTNVSHSWTKQVLPAGQAGEHGQNISTHSRSALREGSSSSKDREKHQTHSSSKSAAYDKTAIKGMHEDPLQAINLSVTRPGREGAQAPHPRKTHLHSPTDRTAMSQEQGADKLLSVPYRDIIHESKYADRGHVSKRRASEGQTGENRRLSGRSLSDTSRRHHTEGAQSSMGYEWPGPYPGMPQGPLSLASPRGYALPYDPAFLQNLPPDERKKLMESGLMSQLSPGQIKILPHEIPKRLLDGTATVKSESDSEPEHSSSTMAQMGSPPVADASSSQTTSAQRQTGDNKSKTETGHKVIPGKVYTVSAPMIGPNGKVIKMDVPIASPPPGLTHVVPPQDPTKADIKPFTQAVAKEKFSSHGSPIVGSDSKDNVPLRQGTLSEDTPTTSGMSHCII